jgi:glucose/arabinose dehydrogenase
VIALALAAALQFPQESDAYTVDWLKPPEKEVLEVGGMGFLPDGRLALSTRRGQVWIVENPLAENPDDAHFTLFAEGLQEGLGLAVVDGGIDVLQRSELSRLADADGDGRCDRIDTLCNSWGVSGHYHEFAFGLPRDADGNFFISLNVSFGNPQWWHGRSTAPWRGWVMKISPQGELEPFACGFRSPCGLGMTEEGDLLETDNQGDWMPVCPVFHVKPGRFYGHPAALRWTKEYLATQTIPSDTLPPEREREPAAVWMPYKWVRSAGNLVPDTTQGKFGHFAHQLFVAELTNGLVARVQLERVRGELQGACFLFRRRVGSAVRVLFAPDGKTLLAGLTNRGWGGLAPAAGIARIRYTGKTPFEMQGVHLLQDGFDVTFTKPLGVGAALPGVEAEMLHYDWWWEYGSPERGNEKLALASSAISADGLHLLLHFSNLRAGEVARVTLAHVRSADGEALVHDEFDYTINQLPEGPLCTTPVARLVPPPPARETGEEGWLRLCYTDAFDLWTSKGWSLVDADVDPADPKKLVTREGNAALVNQAKAGETPSDFVSKPEFGDVRLHAEFMMPEGGGGGVMLMGRYEVRLSADKVCGAVPPGEGFAGEPAALECFKGAGAWHDLDLVFRAPRFDAHGKKTQSARFEKVLVDDILLHESLYVPGPTQGGFEGELPRGPLRFRGDRGAIALGGIQVRPIDEPVDEPGFVPLFDGEDLEGWTKLGDADWKIDDSVLVGSGKKGWLATARADFKDFELVARMKVSDGGDSGIRFRASGDDLAGYEAEVNSSYPDPQHTGSLLGLAPVRAHLVAPDTWFDYRVRCEDEKDGTRIRISIDGVVVTDFLDRARRAAAGRIAIEQHHDGSVIEVKALAVREISR